MLGALALVAGACARPTGAGETGATGAVGPRTRNVDTGAYAHVRYVSRGTGSDDSGMGSAERPWKTIGHALTRIVDAGSAGRYAILVAEGEYRESPLVLKEHVDVFGGFEAAGWRRDIVRHATILDGEGKHRVAIGADQAVLDGVVLRNGSVRGKGGALLLEGVSPAISNNVFTGNQTRRPEPWVPRHWHETALDGGAIACLNGCSATIEHNLFVRNRTEIGRGAGVACDNEATKDRSVAPRVIRNVFLANVASAGADTMRSGDGGAISFYGYCDGEITGNVVAENEAASRNDGGGIFVALWSAPRVAANIIVGNVSGDDAGGLFIGGQKHHYDSPPDPVPPADAFFIRVERNVLMGNRNGSPTSGAFRATMMSRGSFTDNVTAENPGGVHTQRSELTLAHNTFVDGARHEDDERAAPGPTVYRNNIILGRKNIQAPVTEEGTCTVDPPFVQDGFSLRPSGAVYDSARYVTRLHVKGVGRRPGALAGRVVQAGKRWGVVRSNSDGAIEVWGDWKGETAFTIKPSYRVSEDSPCRERGAMIATRD